MTRRCLIVGALLALVGCSGGSSGGLSSAPPLASMTRTRIPGIDRMSLEELSEWVTVCRPYNGSLEGRARNPYDPMDCDQVQFRHDSWHTARTQKPGAYLPPVH